jgi:uncharacterized protein YkwD
MRSGNSTYRTVWLLASVAILSSTGCFGGATSAGGNGADPAGGSETVVLSTGEVGVCDRTRDADDLALQILSLINLERARHGVDPVRMNSQLKDAAEDYACTMASEDFFEHINPVTGEGPGDRAAKAGYGFFSIGENLAGGHLNPAEAVEAWMESPGHRTNLLSPEWKESGVGVRQGGSLRIYWVQLFGKPAQFVSHPEVALTSPTPQ